jgi:hypothetical protein
MLTVYVGGSLIERDLVESADWLETRACNHYGPGQPCSKPLNGEVLGAAERLRDIARHGGPAHAIADELFLIARDLVLPRDQGCASGGCAHHGCHDRLRIYNVLRNVRRQLLQCAATDAIYRPVAAFV